MELNALNFSLLHFRMSILVIMFYHNNRKQNKALPSTQDCLSSDVYMHCLQEPVHTRMHTHIHAGWDNAEMQIFQVCRTHSVHEDKERRQTPR